MEDLSKLQKLTEFLVRSSALKNDEIVLRADADNLEFGICLIERKRDTYQSPAGEWITIQWESNDEIMEENEYVFQVPPMLQEIIRPHLMEKLARKPV